MRRSWLICPAVKFEVVRSISSEPITFRDGESWFRTSSGDKTAHVTIPPRHLPISTSFMHLKIRGCGLIRGHGCLLDHLTCWYQSQISIGSPYCELVSTLGYMTYVYMTLEYASCFLQWGRPLRQNPERMTRISQSSSEIFSNARRQRRSDLLPLWHTCRDAQRVPGNILAKGCRLIIECSWWHMV